MNREIKEDYWEISKHINIESYLNPINLNYEMGVFKENFLNSIPYNPQFEYSEVSFNVRKIISRLMEIRNAFFDKAIPYQSYYKRKIDEDIIYIQNITNRKSPDFSNWLTSLYGIPSKKITKEAELIISKLPASVVTIKNIKSKQLRDIFIEKIQEYNFSNWQVIIEGIIAKVSINPVRKTITIKKDTLFSTGEVERLIAHEIDVHVLRNENGNLQEDKLFQYGFPKYLKTEEGLAITSEYRQNLLSNNDLKKYCSRVIAAYFSSSDDFYSIFKIINKNHSFEQAYSIVSRIKRGLVNTKVLGGYTKDRVYLEGYLELKKFDDNDLKKFFCGKIGIDEFNNINSLQSINRNYLIPSWLKQ